MIEESISCQEVEEGTPEYVYEGKRGSRMTSPSQDSEYQYFAFSANNLILNPGNTALGSEHGCIHPMLPRHANLATQQYSFRTGLLIRSFILYPDTTLHRIHHLFWRILMCDTKFFKTKTF